MRKVDEIKELIKNNKATEDEPVLLGVTTSVQGNGRRVPGLFHFLNVMGFLTSMRVTKVKEQSDGTTDILLSCANRSGLNFFTFDLFFGLNTAVLS